MEKKKKKSFPGWPIGGVVFVAFIAGAPVGVWILIGIAIAYFALRSEKSPEVNNSTSVPITNAYVKPITRQVTELPIQAKTTTVEQSGYSIPPPPKDLIGDAAWLPYGKSIEIGGFNIEGGLLYVGSKLPAANGITDPALIDPRKSISSRSGDFTERLTNYWPSYSEISPEARRAYLRWLADGRKHPEADIGYVFLYFYGLERRSIFDASKEGNTVEADRPYIIAELNRLLSIYGEKSYSFRSYAASLLNVLNIAKFSDKFYENPVPEFVESYELPYYLRLAIGQAAVDGVPVPSHIALAWAEHDPGVTRRTPVRRCKVEFRELFKVKYKQQYGEGIKLAVNRTKLKLTYTPASAGFRGGVEVKLTFGDIPDVTALTGPIKKLQVIVDACTVELEPYSRYLGRNPEKREALEGVLQLPVMLWPESSRKALDILKAQVAQGMVVMTFNDLAAAFKSTGDLTREKVQGLASALESVHVCIEPDILAGAKSPKPEDNVILFHCEPTPIELRTTAAYKVALVTVELAAGVAAADGDFSASEVRYLNDNIESWVHLSPSTQARLKAHVQLLKLAPISLTSLKKKIEPLNSEAREAIASFSATLAQADGVVSPEEVKFLEKIYKLLGVDQKKVFSDIHVASTSENSKTVSTSSNGTGIKLDTARIAALQQDTEKLSALLTNIFNEDEYRAPPPQQDEEKIENKILNLDEAHSAFARMLISRPSWLRSELSDVALDLDVMLDGALERVNEAALDAHDITFTEGDDPIEINPELLEKINS